MFKKLLFSISLLLFLAVQGCAVNHYPPDVSESVHTVFNPMHSNQWIGNGISYSPYRDGESPVTNSLTSKEDILEDLNLIAKNWNLIRLYGSDELSERVLQVIKEHNLPIKVMQGAWISGLQTTLENDKQVVDAVRLANQYKDIVVAVNVGNEILVDWSAHKLTDLDTVIDYIRFVKKSIQQPVTVNDDYNFWNKPQAVKIADEVDFIGLHFYAFWNNKTIDESLAWSKTTFADIQQRFPKKQLVIGETGWPTSRIYDDGSYEGGLMGKANVENLERFFKGYNEWINNEQIASFYFEAFDEKWKGGFDGLNAMDKAEKHWGVYYSNRQPKIELP